MTYYNKRGHAIDCVKYDGSYKSADEISRRFGLHFEKGFTHISNSPTKLPIAAGNYIVMTPDDDIEVWTEESFLENYSKLTPARKHLLTLLPPLQEVKLIEHGDKPDDWRDYELSQLHRLLSGEVAELLIEIERKLRGRGSVNDVLKECGDVSNYTAMIVDKLQAEKAGGKD